MVMFPQVEPHGNDATSAAPLAAVQAALDAVPTPLTVLDAELRLVHANAAAAAMFSAAPAGRGFNPQVGRSLAVAFNGATVRHRRHGALDVTVSDEVHLGGIAYRVVIRPVVGEDGSTAGAVVEWEEIGGECALDACIAAAIAPLGSGRDAKRGGRLVTALRQVFGQLASGGATRHFRLSSFDPARSVRLRLD